MPRCGTLNDENGSLTAPGFRGARRASDRSASLDTRSPVDTATRCRSGSRLNDLSAMRIFGAIQLRTLWLRSNRDDSLISDLHQPLVHIEFLNVERNIEKLRNHFHVR